MELKESKTKDNLRSFQGESEANRRYLYFAQKAILKRNEVAQIFRSTAEGETGAHGHLEYLEEVGAATGELMGNTEQNLKSAIKGETHEYTDMYPGMARTKLEKKAMKS